MVYPSSLRPDGHPSNLVCITVTMNAELCAKSIRELARRILRSRGVIIQLPKHIEIDESLSLTISDLAPSLYFGVEIKIHQNENIVITNIGEAGGLIGTSQPSENEVWIPLDLQTGLNELSLEIIRLAAAGYPGCVGCGGEDAELPWQESKVRLLFD